MGRKLVLALALLFVTGCTSAGTGQSADLFPGCGNSAALGNGIVLMPHHLLVEDYIEAMYESLDSEDWQHVVIVSPDHFHTGATHISTPPETEHGFTVHRDLVGEVFPDATLEGFMLQSEATEAEVVDFVDELLALETAYSPESTLFIFSIDFSHYLPGQIAHVHDLRSMDILQARDVTAARSVEVDSPVAVEVLLRLLVAKEAVLTNMLNTNPSYDIGVDTFENTTHVFACSTGLVGDAPTRDLTVEMFFAHPEDWYKGLTAEDRYLYGYDETNFDQLSLDPNAHDHAVITNSAKGSTTEFIFDYFE